jgi:hypothetical protein
MSTDYRALALHLRKCVHDAEGNWAHINIDALLDAAEYLERFAALSQPEPVGPTDDQAEDLADALNFMDGYAEHEDGFYVCASNLGPFARAVLARYGRSHG